MGKVQTSTFQQMVLSGIVGGVAMGGYLLSSHLLDHRIGFQYANLIGMLIAYLIDFFAQQFIFLGEVGGHSRFIVKFLIHVTIEIIVAQLLLKLVLGYIHKHYPDFYQHRLKGTWISVIRYSIQIFIFLTITFPLRKYFVFV